MTARLMDSPNHEKTFPFDEEGFYLFVKNVRSGCP